MQARDDLLEVLSKTQTPVMNVTFRLCSGKMKHAHKKQFDNKD